jgi:hypothetical protein
MAENRVLSLAWSGRAGLGNRERAREGAEPHSFRDDVSLLAISAGGSPFLIAAAGGKSNSLAVLGIEHGFSAGTPADPELSLSGFSHPADCCALAVHSSTSGIGHRAAIADDEGFVSVFEITPAPATRLGGNSAQNQVESGLGEESEGDVDSIKPLFILWGDMGAYSGSASVEGVQRPLAFSIDGALLVGAVGGTEAVVWDVGSSDVKRRREVGYDQAASVNNEDGGDGNRVVARLRYSNRFNELVFCSVAWSPDGKFLAFGLDLGRVSVYSAGTFKHLRTVSCDSVSAFTALSISPDSETIMATREGAASLHVWPLQKVVVMQRHLGTTCKVHLPSAKVKALCWLDEGLCCVANDRTLSVFDAATGKSHQRVPTGYPLSVVATDTSCGGVVASTHHDSPIIQVWATDGFSRTVVKSARKMG